jgi:hypothetical protein
VVNALHVSPRQLYEASRLADRIGPAYMAELDGGRILMLLATRGGEPDLALELDEAGNIVARQHLDLAHRGEDPCEDFGDEQELPPPVDVRDARPALRCTCPSPRADEETCGRCGHLLPLEVVEAA